MPRPIKKTALVEVIDHYLLGSDRIYQHILQDSMATDHGVIAKECTNKGHALFNKTIMTKYIDAEKLKEELEMRKTRIIGHALSLKGSNLIDGFDEALSIIDSLQQEQQMPDSTQLIAEWEREKAVLEQKDFRGDAERMAYNAFLDGFVKGLGYGRTK